MQSKLPFAAGRGKQISQQQQKKGCLSNTCVRPAVSCSAESVRRAGPCADNVSSIVPVSVHSVATRPTVIPRAAATQTVQSSSSEWLPKEILPGFKVVIAGAGISGLTLALGLLKKGISVQILERDLTAVRGEGKIRGPIQVQSNALAALEAIDPDVAHEVMQHGCITGDRINGLVDGVSGDWYVKFDTFHPAADRGLPVTRVISRVVLQQVLAKHVERLGGEGVIQGGCHVVSYEEFKDRKGKDQVAAVLEDGRRFEGDVLVGTDGIWSKIRHQLLGDSPAHYSEYTCYTGISEYVPADIDLVGYRVFLGNRQYFVSSDVGEGRMQWYAFHREPAGGSDEAGHRKERLLELFGHWNYNVVDLIKATPEEDVLRRDIFDRAPIFKWGEGRVALMGDSAHAMQPNLGQGGCMAIEDAYQLAGDLTQMVEKAVQKGTTPDSGEVRKMLKNYQSERLLRVSAIHGMAGMAAFMASTYKAHLGEGLGPLSWITKYKIPHPGRVVGQVVMKLTMPAVLGWVLGGNIQKLEKARPPHCMVGDKPQSFEESEFHSLMVDNDLLTERADADWLLVAERVVGSGGPSSGGGSGRNSVKQEQPAAYAFAMAGSSSSSSAPSHSSPPTPSSPTVLPLRRQYGLAPLEYKAVYLNLAASGSTGTTIVGSSPSSHLVLEGTQGAPTHAHIVQEAPGRFFLQDLGCTQGSWVNGHRVGSKASVMLHPGDVLQFGRPVGGGRGGEAGGEKFTVKLQHKSYRSEDVRGDAYLRINRGAMVQAA